MSLTDKTKAVFAADLQGVDDMAASFWTQAYIDAKRADTLRFQADYEEMFDLMVRQVTGLDEAKREVVCRMLRQLGGRTSRAGSVDFQTAVTRIHELGVGNADRIFDHDRKWVAENCGGGKV